MSRSCGLAVPAVLLLVLLAATATAAIKPLEEVLQDDKPMDHHHLFHGLPQEEEPATRISSSSGNLRPAAIKPLEEAPQDSGNLRPAAIKPLDGSPQDSGNLRPAEKKDGGDDAAMPMPMPMEGKPSGGVAIQGGDPGTVPSAGSGDANGNGSGNGSGSGEHGKGESGGSGKEAEKSASATKSCFTKEECHKKRLLCGKGCTLSAHAKCAAKCSKSCVPTC